MLADFATSLGDVLLLAAPWLVPFAYALGGVACRLHAHFTAPKQQATSAPSGSAGVAALPRSVHPVLVDALMSNELLADSDRGTSFVEWFAASVVHAAGTDGSVVVETHVPVDDEPGSILASVKVTRTRTPSDPIDALLISVFLPTGEGDEEQERLAQALETSGLNDRSRKRMHAVLLGRRRPRRDSVTLQELVDEAREEHGPLSSDFRRTREALARLATETGYQIDDPYHGKVTHGPLAAGVLLWTVFGAPIADVSIALAGGPGLPNGPVPLLILLTFVVLVWASANLVYPWGAPLTQTGANVAAAGAAVANESADDLARQTERDQLLSAAFLVAHGPREDNATQLAALLAHAVEGKPGTGMLAAVATQTRGPLMPDDPTAEGWRRANASFCSPVFARGESRRRATTALSLCCDRFLSAEVAERDDGVDVQQPHMRPPHARVRPSYSSSRQPLPTSTQPSERE